MIVPSYYILVRNHTEGMALHEELRAKGFAVRISPAPRATKACCGMSLLVKAEEIEAVKEALTQSTTPIDRIVELENQIDPTRDKYC